MRLVHYSATPELAPRSVREQPTDHKPKGLWVSDDAAEITWRKWCATENHEPGRLKHRFAVQLAADIHILILRSADDIDIFGARYGLACSDRPDRKSDVDWARVARTLQGIIITPYVWQRRRADQSYWYRAWDCACGCIWDADAIKSATLLPDEGKTDS
jgi:hypothetical protein